MRRTPDGRSFSCNVGFHRSLVGLVFVLGAHSGLAEVAAPVLNPVEGDSLAFFNVIVTCPTPGVQIHYTLNGTDPTALDPSVASGGVVAINRNWTLKAKAWSSTEESATTTGNYILTGDLSAGGSHSLGMKSNGAVWAWGLQTNGRLGNNQPAAANISTPAVSLYSTTSAAVGDAQMVAAGKSHSVFLKTGGMVWSYGLNATGALGDTFTTDRTKAVRVCKTAVTTDYLTGCVAVTAGDGFSGALHGSGEVYTWGSRVNGRLADSTTVVTGNRLFAGKVLRADTGLALGGINRVAFSAASGMAKEPSAYEQAGTSGQVWVWGSKCLRPARTRKLRY